MLDSVGHHRITVREADGRQHTLSAASDPDTSVHSRCPGVAATPSSTEQIRAFEVTKKHTQRKKKQRSRSLTRDKACGIRRSSPC